MRAFLFLLDSVGGFFCGVLLLRFLMQVFRVSFANPVGSATVQLTDWLVRPLRRVLPGVGGLDLASLLPAYLLQVVLLAAAFWARGGLSLGMPDMLLGFLFWQALLATLRVGIYLMVGALVIQAVLSWVSPYSPVAHPVGQFTRPLLAPLRRVIPPLGMVDLSPLVAVLLLQLLLIFL